LAVLALAVTACPKTPPGGSSSSGSGGTSGGTTSSGGFDAGFLSNSCLRDQDCGAGRVCGEGDAGCVTGMTCVPGGAQCGECEVGGRGQCGFPRAPAYCDSAAQTCRRILGSCEPCTHDEMCGENLQLGLPNVCVDYGSGQRFCGLACSGANCSEGFACQSGACKVATSVGTCAGAVPCTAEADCPSGKHCTTYAADPPRRGVCLGFCLQDAECPSGKICQGQPGAGFGTCIQGCPPGTTAGSGQICHEWGRYGPTCPGTPCPEGYDCKPTGFCQQAGCDNDDECPLVRTICDVPTRTCVPGCNDVEDCGAFELCQANTCVPQGCRGKDLSCNLGQFCCGKELYAPEVQACPQGVEDGACFDMPDPFCRTCEDDDGCADIHNFGQPSHCYEIQIQDRDGGTQSLGKYCSVGCQGNADCPRGIGCRDLQGPNGEAFKGCLDARCAGARHLGDPP
jgi:hypothetical protein